ncbi:unnamed protein product [Lactuca virosa]|uniref:Uncharacterized protein n=1 Tax=Lactuca virosa TaxID=75947 RepID=A0AAU9M359_9ASTR|nr:unnamed protein product [Lactuca virosa]
MVNTEQEEQKVFNGVHNIYGQLEEVELFVAQGLTFLFPSQSGCTFDFSILIRKKVSFQLELHNINLTSVKCLSPT